MRSFWSCSCCVVPLFLAVFAIGSEAAEFKRRDGIHRVEKALVTTVFHDLQRRAVTSCQASHTLCPGSLNGGCCSDGYACATDSCYATTRGPQTCGGRANFYACAADVGGGCCPEGTVCQRGDACLVPDGSDMPQSCPQQYFLCPASLNYGCCPNGMGCAKNACYSTEPSTFTFTQTVTTTDAAAATITTTVTRTTLVTPSPPLSAPTAGNTGDPTQAVLKFYPSYIPKVDPSVDKSDDSNDLTMAQIAGIVGGAIGFLIIVLVAAFIIIRHLNKVVKVVESSKGGGTSSTSKPRPQMHQFRPTPSEVDDMSVDPLMMSPRPSHRRQDSDPDMMPYGLGTPEFASSYRGTPSSSGGYHAVPMSTGSSGDRHASFDSVGNPQGYFEVLPGHAPRFSGQSSVLPGSHRISGESQGTYAHGRHWSNASEASSDAGTTGARTPLQELDATPFVPELPATPTTESPGQERRRSSGSGAQLLARPLPHPRRRSESHNRGRSDSSANPTQLGVVTEDTEVIGHYGPSDQVNGQTAAGLSRVESGGTSG